MRARLLSLARSPAGRQPTASSSSLPADVGRADDVEAHRDVGAELRLDLRRELGREPREVAVVDRAEGDALLVDA